ncbi:Rieske (2Fe-2S) protein [Dactylosporangium sp. CA-052675]|uniref:Rieske (2Fe-2S) protein n=1 Tax=Dactylosporangium sp. CA-052675 TaxID=3239927 RepID=UPI003D92609C
MCTPTRRTLLAGATAAGLATALSGCAAYGLDSANPASPADNAAGTGDGGTGDQSGAGPDGAAANAASFAKTSDIPVGGGKIFADQKIVVTQPTAGTFRCFTAVCTHAGCVVGDVSEGTINCPCHGSRFKVADASVAAGPAKKALGAIAIKVTGDAISKA